MVTLSFFSFFFLGTFSFFSSCGFSSSSMKSLLVDVNHTCWFFILLYNFILFLWSCWLRGVLYTFNLGFFRFHFLQSITIVLCCFHSFSIIHSIFSQRMWFFTILWGFWKVLDISSMRSIIVLYFFLFYLWINTLMNNTWIMTKSIPYSTIIIPLYHQNR